MKAIQIVTYFFLFNAFLFIFSSLGIYSMDVNMQIMEDKEGLIDMSESTSVIESVLMITGIGLFAAVGIGVVAHFLAGVSGLQLISMSVLGGFFTALFYNTYSMLQGIATGLGEFAFVINTFILLTGTVFVISIIWGVAQMGMGGAKAYE